MTDLPPKPSDSGERPAVKKPWVKPRVKSSALLDRRALMACSGQPQSVPGPPPFGCTGIISG